MSNFPVETVEEGGLPRVQGRDCGGVLIAHRQSQHGVLWGDQGGNPPPPIPPRGGPNLLGLFTENYVAAPVPSGGVPGRGLESEQPTGSLFAPPHAGYNSDPG